jgi:histidyl-tRNA synthetase
METTGRSLKGQLKHADRLGARWVAIVGADAVTLRDMDAGEQREGLSSSDVLVAIT